MFPQFNANDINLPVIYNLLSVYVSFLNIDYY
jgi:hypothetical protein